MNFKGPSFFSPAGFLTFGSLIRLENERLLSYLTDCPWCLHRPVSTELKSKPCHVCTLILCVFFIGYKWSWRRNMRGGCHAN